MTALRGSDPRRGTRPDPVAALLREEFSREVAAQRGQHPDAETILLLSALAPPSRAGSSRAILADWLRALALGLSVTLLALWWNDAKALCEALMPPGAAGWS